jgi:hypothetical protein
MVAVSTDPTTAILALDQGHAVWIDGISQSCGLEAPSMAQPMGVNMDAYTRIWSFVWLVGRTDAGYARENYGVRITQQGKKFDAVVRGPQGWARIEHWDWFPGPDVMINLAMLVGFDWAPRRGPVT